MTAAADILLVEDNASEVELALHALKRDLGGTIVVARDGADALEYLFCTGRHSGRIPGAGPRVVLLDLNLPLVSGKEVLRSLKSDPRTRDIPVIALTSSAEESDIVDSYRLGVNSYVVKPVDFDEYAEALHQIGRYWLKLNENPPR